MKVIIDATAMKQELVNKVNLMINPEYLLRQVCFDVAALMRIRIHENGSAADGSQIGEYKDSYMSKRKKNKRGESRQVIVSLTRDLENHWITVADPTGYGIGFTDQLNYNKARWAEEHFGKQIFFLSDDEQKYAYDMLEQLIHDALNG